MRFGPEHYGPFVVACILVSAFVGWSIGQIIVHVMRVLVGVPT